jgi:hypothetical protein
LAGICAGTAQGQGQTSRKITSLRRRLQQPSLSCRGFVRWVKSGIASAQPAACATACWAPDTELRYDVQTLSGLRVPGPVYEQRSAYSLYFGQRYMWFSISTSEATVEHAEDHLRAVRSGDHRISVVQIHVVSIRECGQSRHFKLRRFAWSGNRPSGRRRE